MISLKDKLEEFKKVLHGDEEIPIMYIHALIAIIGSVAVLFILEYKELPMTTLEHTLLALVEKTCVILVIAYVVSRLSYFTEVLEGKFTIKNQAILILIFGAISIFGTYSGVDIFGAMANVRDLGPMVAGLIGGPVMGIGAGLIGGLYRLSIGGFTAIPCAISTILAGFLAGMVYLINKRKFVGVFWAVVFAVLMESIHMLITLTIAQPYDQALLVVQGLTLPMIVANGLGMFIFALIISNILREQETIRQRDMYFDELERKKHEIEVANKIQKSFLPESLPDIHGLDLAAISITAHELGGAFYDFIPTSNNKLGVVIADVVGDSFPSSILMALSRTIIRGESRLQDPPSLLRYLNNLITIDIGPDLGLTIFYGTLDINDYSLKYVNASHSPPLIYRNDTREFEELIKDEKLLGNFEHLELDQHEIKLFKDDMIFFYTFGIIQALETDQKSGQDVLKKIIRHNHDLGIKKIAEIIRDKSIINETDDLIIAIIKRTD